MFGKNNDGTFVSSRVGVKDKSPLTIIISLVVIITLDLTLIASYLYIRYDSIE